MNRRAFFKKFGSLAAATAAGIILPPSMVELLAPEKTIFLPPVGGWRVQTQIVYTATAIQGLEGWEFITSSLIVGPNGARYVKPNMTDAELMVEIRPGERLLPGHVQYWKEA